MKHSHQFSPLFNSIHCAWSLILILTLALTAVSPQLAQAAPPGPSTPTTYWVNDPGDAPDMNPGDGLCQTSLTPLPGTNRFSCTLRAAIQEANTLISGADVIAFEICGEDFTANADGSYTIAPVEPLPAITDGLTYINGYTQGYPQTQAGYDDPSITGSCTTTRTAAPNTNSFSQPLNSVLAIAIDGGSCITPAPQNDFDATTPVSGGFVPSGSIIQWNGTAGACSGFTVTSDRNVFAGLNIRNWRNAGILIMPLVYTIDPERPSENVVWGDFIGTDIFGQSAQANRFGVQVIGGSHSNYMGDTTAVPGWNVGDPAWVEEFTNNERNLISGNDNPQFIYGYNCLEGGGSTRFRDDGAGVFLGVDPCIRQNGSDQAIIFTAGALDNHIRNSYIGTNYQGQSAVPNSTGVWLNYDAGADSLDFGVTYLPGNHIGGCVAFPFTAGALAGGCEPQTVDEEQDPNLISGNSRRTAGGVQQTIGGHGVWLNGFTSADSHKEGDFDVSYNEIGGNFIGTDATGLAKLPNSGDGVYVLANQTVTLPDGPDHNEIGATTEYLPGLYPYQPPYTPTSYQYGNLISGNGSEIDEDPTMFGRWDNGVEMRGSGAEYNRVGYGNTIGLNSQGDKVPNDLGNGENGVFIWFGAQYNLIHNNSGGSISTPYANAPADLPSTFGAISENGDFASAPRRNGIDLSNSAQFNYIFRNCIGGDAVDTPGGSPDDCGGEFGNHDKGIYIEQSAVHTWVGVDNTSVWNSPNDQQNWIHHNGTDGVAVVGDNTRGNLIRFNRIWLNGNPTDGNLGIDLLDNNDTPNDVGDIDLGPNLTQNYPDNISGSTTWRITFTQPAGCTSALCITDIYASLLSESDDPTNNGEGRYWLRSYASGTFPLDISAEINAVFGGIPPENICVSMTTTRQQGTGGSPSTSLRNTSEFSPCIRFTPTAVTLTGLAARSGVGGPVIWLAGSVIVLCGALVIFKRTRQRKA